MSNNSSKKRAAKKAEILKEEEKNTLFSRIILIACVLVIAGTIFFLTRDDNSGGKRAEDVSTENSYNRNSESGNQYNAKGNPADTGQAIKFPVSTFNDGKARHYQYNSGEQNIKFFVLKSSDGVIRAAFDACDVCWRAGKGYYQDGDEMVCRNCGRRFASALVNEVQGGCNPAPLKRQIDGDNVVINISDIKEGKGFFNFPRGG